ncbi:hypothetical protein C8R44DRAFT_723724 [Mycena epipterygia]|nr:hypothetical protein C8R44DRAFT_723724 [Mycena epipterygia]
MLASLAYLRACIVRGFERRLTTVRTYEGCTASLKGFAFQKEVLLSRVVPLAYGGPDDARLSHPSVRVVSRLSARVPTRGASAYAVLPKGGSRRSARVRRVPTRLVSRVFPLAYAARLARLSVAYSRISIYEARPFSPARVAQPASLAYRISRRDTDMARLNTSFTATLYTSESATARYADEEGAGLRELCVWRADVGVLPAFQEGLAVHSHRGFYTNFEVGLEFDSAEVRGVLLSAAEDGPVREWGAGSVCVSVICDYGVRMTACVIDEISIMLD